MTHAGLTAGYQIAQIAHAVAEYAHHAQQDFALWRTHSERIIALQTPSMVSLEELLHAAHQSGLTAIKFREPDINNSLTAVAFIPDARNKPFLKGLALAGTNTRTVDKHATLPARASNKTITKENSQP